MPHQWWVIGIGADFRGDDGLGHWVIDALIRDHLRGERSTHPLTLVKLNDVSRLLYFSAPERSLVIIDAVRAAQLPAGTVLRYQCSAQTLQKDRVQTSTHSLGLAEALELMQVMGQFPKQVFFYGVVGQSFGIGDQPSAPVLDQVAAIAKEVMRCVSAPTL